MKSSKKRDLLIVTAIYVLAFAVGFAAGMHIENMMIKQLVFDVVATIVTFIFSVLLKNSSVYDAYWSLTPMVMSVWLFVVNKSFAPFQLIFLVVFNIWSLRLTMNWIKVFTDFTYEDWRYKKYREETHRILWPIVNFGGIHMMPTILVFLGMLPMYVISDNKLGYWSVFGFAIMLMGVAFEFFADMQMHRHLSQSESKSVCREGLWKYSRHPNYLGEISFWIGVYLAMLPYAIEYWYYGIGALGMVILFNVVSIPLMEKRQLKRRPEYSEYKKETSRLLILPKKRVR